MKGCPKTKKKSNPAAKILVTAGPTIEPLDPVRYISNYSTAEMGYAIAEEARNMGFLVCLVTGPTHLTAPLRVKTVKIKTALEMAKEVKKRVKKCDCVIMSSAVCDFRPLKEEKKKIKKDALLYSRRDFKTLKLVKNPDILEQIGTRKGLVKIGFALETENVLKNARIKIKKKGLDLIVANLKTSKKNPFGPGAKDFFIMDNKGNFQKIKNVKKKQMAKIIIAKAKKLMS